MQSWSESSSILSSCCGDEHNGVNLKIIDSWPDLFTLFIKFKIGNANLSQTLSGQSSSPTVKLMFQQSALAALALLQSGGPDAIPAIKKLMENLLQWIMEEAGSVTDQSLTIYVNFFSESIIDPITWPHQSKAKWGGMNSRFACWLSLKKQVEWWQRS